jgi:hypothetical protein
MEERVAQLELITKRLMRRSHKVASSMITPYPISSAIFSDKVEGVILRYMFPCEGKISKGAIDLGKKPKDDVKVTIDISGELGGTSKSFTVSKRRMIIEPDIEVKTFDQLTISISYNFDKAENNLTEVWTSLLWVPSIKDVDVKSFLIDEIESSVLEGVDK